MLKSVMWLFVVCCGLMVAIAGETPASAEDSVSSQRPLKIGIVLPLTGSVANLGLSARRGAELAAEAIERESKGSVTLYFQDDGMEPGRSMTAFRKLVDVDGVDGLISFSSGTGQVVAQAAESKKLPHLAIASDPAIVKDRTFSFLYWVIPDTEVVPVVELLKTKQKKKIAVVTLVHNGALAIRGALLQRLSQEMPGTEIVDEEVPGDTKDFRSIISKLRRGAEPDTLVPILFPGQLATFVRQARDLGMQSPVYGVETFEDADEVKSSKGMLVGSIYATNSKGSTEFVTAFQNKHGRDASSYAASNFYDAVTLLVRGFKKNQGSTGVVEFLDSLQNEPLASGVISSTGDKRFVFPVILKIVGQDGFFELK